MKPLEKRIKEAVKFKKIRQDIIQQDYILSWLLVGIFNHPRLQSSLVFKGGTALKKGFYGRPGLVGLFRSFLLVKLFWMN
jgi:predicted nucleotidyltransferase component of viral defense system